MASRARDPLDDLDLDLDTKPKPKPKRISPILIIVALIVMSMIIGFAVLASLGSAAKADVQQLQGDFVPIQATLQVLNQPLPESQALQRDLSSAQSLASGLNAGKATAVSGYPNWPAVAAAIGNYDPNTLIITSVVQSGNQVTIKGRAADDNTVVSYAGGLLASNLFSRVGCPVNQKHPDRPGLYALGHRDRACHADAHGDQYRTYHCHGYRCPNKHAGTRRRRSRLRPICAINTRLMTSTPRISRWG